MDSPNELIPEPVEQKEEPKEISISKEDRLEAENLQLHVLLLSGAKERFIKECQERLARLDSDLASYKVRVTLFQEKLSAKYGIDFKTQAIEPETGRVVTVTTQPKA